MTGSSHRPSQKRYWGRNPMDLYKNIEIAVTNQHTEHTMHDLCRHRVVRLDLKASSDGDDGIDPFALALNASSDEDFANFGKAIIEKILDDQIKHL